MNPVVLERTIFGGVLSEGRPLRPGLLKIFRGVDFGGEQPPSPSLGANGPQGPYRHAHGTGPGGSAGAPRVVLLRDATDWIAQDPTHSGHFEREARARIGLSGGPSPSVLHTLGRENTLLIIVEEHLAGAPLSSLLLAHKRRRDKAVPAHVALAIGQALLPLWMQAEHLGIDVTLDVTRVLLAPDGRARARPRVVRTSASEPVPRHPIGLIDAEYGAPEHVLGGKPGPRSGMFTLGMMLYEMLAGVSPRDLLRGGKQGPIERASLLDFPPLRRQNKHVHPTIVEIVHRCLARDPEGRFDTWKRLAEALAGAQALLAPAGAQEIGEHARRMLPAEEIDNTPSIVGPAAPAKLPDLGYRPILLSSHEKALSSSHEKALSSSHEKALSSSHEKAPHEASGARERTVIPEPRRRVEPPDLRPMYAVAGAYWIDARPVSRADLKRFCGLTGAPLPPHFTDVPAASDDDPSTYVPVELAQAYARWAGKRLPREEEWDQAIVELGAERLGTGAVWEWVLTPHTVKGWVIRGGKWRDQPDMAPRPRNRSFAVAAAPDLGFRCVADRT